MANVIPVGPIDPVLYGFAKKQAEKAERDPRYVPKRLETPAHSITYRRVGATVKAFVIDKIAPITYSRSDSSALPITPYFHDNSKRAPEGTHFYDFQGLVIGTLSIYSAIVLSTLPNQNQNVSGGLLPKSFGQVMFGNMYPAHARSTHTESSETEWEFLYGAPPPQLVGASEQGEWDGGYKIKLDDGNCIVDIEERHKGVSSWAPETGLGLSAEVNREISYSFVSVGDTRQIKSAASLRDAMATVTMDGGRIDAHDVIAGGYTSSSGVGKYKCVELDVGSTVVAADGSYLTPGIDIDIETSPDQEGNGWLAHKLIIRHVVARNFDKNDYVVSENRIEHWSQFPTYAPHPYYARAKVASHQTLYVVSTAYGFSGISIKQKFYEVTEYNDFGFIGYKSSSIEFDNDSPIVKTGMYAYFKMQKSNNNNGKYVLNNRVQYLRGEHACVLGLNPLVVASGVCLPHAWFYIPRSISDVHNSKVNSTVNIVIYPSNRTEFFLEDAGVQILSIEFSHPDPDPSTENGRAFLEGKTKWAYVKEIWLSVRTNKAYVTFWDDRVCEVSDYIKEAGDGSWVRNNEWREKSFSYPYPNMNKNNNEIPKGVFTPFVHAYIDYEDQT